MTTDKDQLKKLLPQLEHECEMVKNESSRISEDDETSGWCEVVWDNVMCWNRTRPGTIAKLQCPKYIPKFRTTELAERICTENGTWWLHPELKSSWTNFSKCLSPAVDISLHIKQADNLILLYTIGYSISLISLIVAVIIMVYLRRLHCKSNTLHINLFIAFILRASMSFMKDRLFVYGLGLPNDVREGQESLVFVQEGIHWECRVLFVLLMFAISASQTWMLMEGLYLYLLIHKTMSTERLGVTPYIILGWVLPWTFLIPWIVVKSFFENTYCWNMQENPSYFWILKGPWTAIVVINFFFFLDIIRVLMTRVRDSQRHAGRSQYKKFGKFILVLIPLFGIMYIVLNVAFPLEVKGLGYNVNYLYVEMCYNSFQGFILALLFCFLNEDVHSEIRRTWQRHRSRRQNSNILMRSAAQSSLRRPSRSSGFSPPAVDEGCIPVKYNLNQTKLIRSSRLPKSISVYSSYFSNGCTQVNGEGSRPVTLVQLGNCSCRNGSKDVANITLL